MSYPTSHLINALLEPDMKLIDYIVTARAALRATLTSKWSAL